MKHCRFIIRKVLALVVLFVLAGGLFPAPARAQQATGINLLVSPAYDGYFKYGEWLPIWVQVENSGADRQAEIRVRIANQYGATRYAAQVELPGGSRKRIPVYVLPNNYSHEIEIQLVSGDDLLASAKAVVKPQPNVAYIVGLVAPQRGPLSLINSVKLPGQQRPIYLVDMSLADIPDRVEGLRTLNTLILDGIDSSTLTAGPASALETWVRQGGRLVVGGGAGAAQTAAGLPASLLPFELSGAVEVEALPGLEAYAAGEGIKVPGPFVVSSGTANGGTILASQPGAAENPNLPLLHEWKTGNGFVDFVALDLVGAPFDAWTGTISFWTALLSPNGRYPEWLPFDTSLRQSRAGSLTYALTNLPALALPSIRNLSILLGIYILLVGPLNYLFLRWRKRMNLAWITIPVITLLFSAGSFGLGYAMRGTDLILNKIAIVEVRPDGDASVSTYMGLFSPTQQSYDIQVQGGGLLSPLNMEYDPWSGAPNLTGSDAVFYQGDPGRVMGLIVNQWSMQSFMTEGTWQDFGQVSSDLQLKGQSLVGKVRNDTQVVISGAVLIVGNQFVRLGDLAPGEEKPVTMQLPTMISSPFDASISYKMFQVELEKPSPTGPPRAIQLKQAMVDSLYQWGNWFGPVTGTSTSVAPTTGASSVILLGWLDQAPPDVQVSKRQPAQQTTALLLQTLPYHLPDQDHIALPPGMIPGTITDMGDGGYCGPMGAPAVYFGSKDVVFDFQIPTTLPIETDSGDLNLSGIKIESLLLHIGSEGGWTKAPETALYDWNSEVWGVLDNPVTGQNVIRNAAGYVDKDGRVRVRVSPANFGGCFYLGLGLEGSR